MFADCTLCGKPTKLPIERANGLPVRHRACHIEFMRKLEKGRL